MVCSHCEKKLGKLIVPDKWKEGARNVSRGSDGRGESREENNRRVVRSIEQSRRTLKSDPMGKSCRICHTQIEHWANYCTSCAFKKGICARCGRKVQDTKFSHMRDR